jgi:ankyrin repeat protein
MLAKSGANLNSQEIQNKTPLMLAIDNQSIEIVNFLLEHDADIYIQDNRTLYALHYAAQYGYNDIVEAIILKGGTRVVQVVDYVNCTPIHWACLYGQTKTIDILLDHGADINATTYYKRTPISFACERGFMDTVQFLVERGANVNIKDDRGLLPDCCEDTLETFRRLWYGNPLMRAMFDEDLNEFIQLLSNCDEETANQEIGDGHGWTVLHAAVYLDRVDFVDHMVKCDKIQMKNTHMPRMLSAMHIACGKNNSRMIKILADRLNREAV